MDILVTSSLKYTLSPSTYAHTHRCTHLHTCHTYTCTCTVDSNTHPSTQYTVTHTRIRTGCTHIYEHPLFHMPTHVHTCMHTHTHTQTHTHTPYTHTHTTHTHTHKHTLTPTSVLSPTSFHPAQWFNLHYTCRIPGTGCVKVNRDG